MHFWASIDVDSPKMHPEQVSDPWFESNLLVEMGTLRACSWVPCQDVVAVRSTSGRTFMFHFQTPVAQGGPSRCIQARLLWSCLSNLSESHGRPCVWRAIDQPSAAFKASLSWSVSRFRRFRLAFGPDSTILYQISTNNSIFLVQP